MTRQTNTITTQAKTRQYATQQDNTSLEQNKTRHDTRDNTITITMLITNHGNIRQDNTRQDNTRQ